VLSNFGDVGTFQVKHHLPNAFEWNVGPREVDRDVLLFRVNFLIEEILEFIEGAGMAVAWDPIKRTFVVKYLPGKEMDHAKMFDALIDEVYVAMGTAHILGYPWQRGWRLVQIANMKKVRAQRDGSDSARGSSFDVVKPPGWVAPDIAGLLAELGWPTTEGN